VYILIFFFFTKSNLTVVFQGSIYFEWLDRRKKEYVQLNIMITNILLNHS
jgi:hypothetical protein